MHPTFPIYLHRLNTLTIINSSNGVLIFEHPLEL
jgi:hypothetical protein